MSRDNSVMNRQKILLLFVLASILINDVYARPPKRLIGGSDALPGEIPFQASLRLNGKHRCGGALVSTRNVITAAHCIVDLLAPYENLIAVTGTNSLDKGGVESKIYDIQIHDNFTTNTDGFWRNDIAVITLVDDVDANTYQSPIGLANEETPNHAACLISGWIYEPYDYFPNTDFSPILQKSDMTILANYECQLAYNGNTIDHHDICGFKNSFSGICEGDVGSPLIYNGSLVGISSCYYPCDLGLPDVYTSVYHHLEWILDIIRGHNSTTISALFDKK